MDVVLETLYEGNIKKTLSINIFIFIYNKIPEDRGSLKVPDIV